MSDQSSREQECEDLRKALHELQGEAGGRRVGIWPPSLVGIRSVLQPFPILGRSSDYEEGGGSAVHREQIAHLEQQLRDRGCEE